MGYELNGSRLREARRYRRLTITSLSEEIGVSKQMISRYERGTAQPGLDIFQQIVKSLQFPVAFLQVKISLITKMRGHILEAD